MTQSAAEDTVPDAPANDGDRFMGAPLHNLARHCRTFKGADARRGLIQLSTSLGLLAMLAGLMLWSVAHHRDWVAPLLWLPAGGLLVRLFIIQHDCGHGSFFSTRAANTMTGRALSLLTWTPYGFWRDAHALHHAGSGNLDQRGIGSIDTLTVGEYRVLPLRQRLAYRFYRNPLVMLVLGPPLYVVVLQRLPLTEALPFYKAYRSLPFRKIWRSILGLDLALIGFYGGLGLLFGPGPVMMTFLPPVMIAAWAGGWLFFIQHQFEETYWQPGQRWNAHSAALLGSSYYVLPKFLQWFTGNIGLHHIHHLCSAIPNYKLQDCLDESPELQAMNRMTIPQSLRCVPLALWDEAGEKMVSFRQATFL